MKFLVPNYNCLQNHWLRGYRPQIPVPSVLNWICWTPPPKKKFLGTPLTWTILCLLLPSPHPNTSTTFNHMSLRHGISILQMVATSTKTALHNSASWEVSLYDPYTECHAMKEDGVAICTAEVLILTVPKLSRNTRAAWHMLWYKCRKAWQSAIFLFAVVKTVFQRSDKSHLNCC